MGHIWTPSVSQDNNLLTEGFLVLVSCSTALLLALSLMRLITAKSGCAAQVFIKDAGMASYFMVLPALKSWLISNSFQ
jgi:hypothetical protein